LKGRTIVWILVVVSIVSNVALALNGSFFDFLDEQVYITAALQLAHGQSCSIVAIPFSTLCNYEHPPLVKALEALSFYAFGWAVPNAANGQPVYQSALADPLTTAASFLSFRFFQLIMGALSLPLVYSIAFSISKNQRLAILAPTLLLLDPLYAFFSRTAYLDIPMVFFALCAYAAYFGGFRLGALNEYCIAGVLLALSTLSKETGVIFLVPLIVYHLVFGGSSLSERVRGALVMVASDAAVAAVGLQLYDTLARTPFPTFLNQISYMLNFSSGIACGSGCYANFASGAWYFFLTSFYWAEGLSNNQILLWLILLWIPFGLWALFKGRGGRTTPENRLFVFAGLLFATTFAANGLIYLGGRIVWIWYLLPVIPALSLGGAYLLTRQEIPSRIRAAIFALVVLGCFWAYLVGPKMLMYD
jgi:4-amino-4-deoxy-L-arabinose transferase-like glycosyltransferase